MELIESHADQLFELAAHTNNTIINRGHRYKNSPNILTKYNRQRRFANDDRRLRQRARSLPSCVIN